MSKRILSFPGDSEVSEIPRPVNAQTGDSFVQVDVTDDEYAHAGFIPGAVLVAQTDRVSEGALHYVEREGYGFLARVGKAATRSIQLTPLNNATPTGTYSRDGLDFIGQIVEIYPRGLSGSRWVLYPLNPVNATRPVLGAVAN